ncbi:hypothetical protein F8M41_007289 [Gigaspora margarita]|uniref:Uncharacterized protein n=1 Tax=Gigaspora margarita TaxID=4874 RepID=A0A8H4AWB2_GIGMA|nr:hypothetical protein F8M41_007289 [Gigaspora margarita]
MGKRPSYPVNEQVVSALQEVHEDKNHITSEDNQITSEDESEDNSYTDNEAPDNEAPDNEAFDNDERIQVPENIQNPFLIIG